MEIETRLDEASKLFLKDHTINQIKEAPGTQMIQIQKEFNSILREKLAKIISKNKSVVNRVS